MLDATDPNLRVLQRHQEAIDVAPRIPLGTRGTWHGAPWEVIGFQVVTITVDDTDYSWTEYVLFNPYRGFLYLSEYQGHWNVIEKLRRRPSEERTAGRPIAVQDGRYFRHFQTATARTTMALGEFPWELRVGDAVIARDFIAPPYILSAEASDGETTWSLGTYTPAEVIAKAFGQSRGFSDPIGVFANQPNPHDATAIGVFRRFGLFVLRAGRHAAGEPHDVARRGRLHQSLHLHARHRRLGGVRDARPSSSRAGRRASRSTSTPVWTTTGCSSTSR